MKVIQFSSVRFGDIRDRKLMDAASKEWPLEPALRVAKLLDRTEGELAAGWDFVKDEAVNERRALVSFINRLNPKEAAQLTFQLNALPHLVIKRDDAIFTALKRRLSTHA